MTVITQALLAFALAFLAESMVEYVFATWIDIAKAKWPAVEAAEPLKYIALLVGVGLSFAYSLDLLAVAFPEQQAVTWWIGRLLTGMAIGRGSNYVHAFYSSYLVKKDAREN
jgi:hypothetical protein